MNRLYWEPLRTCLDGRQLGTRRQTTGWYVCERFGKGRPWADIRGPFQTNCAASTWIRQWPEAVPVMVRRER